MQEPTEESVSLFCPTLPFSSSSVFIHTPPSAAPTPTLTVTLLRLQVLPICNQPWGSLLFPLSARLCFTDYSETFQHFINLPIFPAHKLSLSFSPLSSSSCLWTLDKVSLFCPVLSSLKVLSIRQPQLLRPHQLCLRPEGDEASSLSGLEAPSAPIPQLPDASLLWMLMNQMWVLMLHPFVFFFFFCNICHLQ